MLPSTTFATTNATRRRRSSPRRSSPERTRSPRSIAAESRTQLSDATLADIRAIVADELARRQPDAPTAAPEWLDADAAAAWLGLHPRTLARMAARGELPAAKVGRQARYRLRDLEAHLALQLPKKGRR